MVSPKGKRKSTGSDMTVVSNVFDPAASEDSVSDLSDYAENLSDCSEAQEEKRLKQYHAQKHLTLHHQLEPESEPNTGPGSVAQLFRAPSAHSLRARKRQCTELLPTSTPKRARREQRRSTSTVTPKRIIRSKNAAASMPAPKQSTPSRTTAPAKERKSLTTRERYKISRSSASDPVRATASSNALSQPTQNEQAQHNSQSAEQQAVEPLTQGPAIAPASQEPSLKGSQLSKSQFDSDHSFQITDQQFAQPQVNPIILSSQRSETQETVDAIPMSAPKKTQNFGIGHLPRALDLGDSISLPGEFTQTINTYNTVSTQILGDNPDSTSPGLGSQASPAPIGVTGSLSSVPCSPIMTEEPVIKVAASTLHLEEFRAITKQVLGDRKDLDKRPQPSSEPEIWADSRMELCESLHYFRAYQGGTYNTGGYSRAFMFNKQGLPRDYMDCDIVISRAAGGLSKNKATGEMRIEKDQDERNNIESLKRSMEYLDPVVLITGSENENMPSKPPRLYCVLDHFKPTHIWWEKSNNMKVIRFRFEKLNTKKPSWWQPKDAKSPFQLGSLPLPVEHICAECKETFQQIYLQGWMCLNSKCESFWKLSSSEEADEATLTYDPRFLKQKTIWGIEDHTFSLMSNNMDMSAYSVAGESCSMTYWQGIVCPQCGRCNSRINWEGWECGNLHCDFKKAPAHTFIPAIAMRETYFPVTNSYTPSRDNHIPPARPNVSFAYNYRINRYTIPGIEGFVTHMVANKVVLEEPGGPDSMFEELQKINIGLRRRPMKNNKLNGETYTRHFTVNYGMPYKFIAATASHSFDNAARPITEARSRLNWAAKLLLAQKEGKSINEISRSWKTKEFNEVLALGYFEKQKINYHDDGEHGLGPTIATLSLGAPGTMKLRLKALHFNGCSKADLYTDEPPLPGCHQYEARVALQPELAKLKATDRKAYDARRREIPKQLGLKKGGQAKDVITMKLGHGDIVVMHGAALQKYYEHAVEHEGKLRFALTCRYIDPDSLAKEDRPEYDVGPDMGEYNGSRLGI